MVDLILFSLFFILQLQNEIFKIHDRFLLFRSSNLYFVLDQIDLLLSLYRFDLQHVAIYLDNLCLWWWLQLFGHFVFLELQLQKLGFFVLVPYHCIL